MSVRNRIKILEVQDYEEVEKKVNHFLSTDNDIAQLVNIDYKLEYKMVIIEYWVFDAGNNNNNNNLKIDYNYTNIANPFDSWMKYYCYSLLMLFPYYIGKF